MLCVLDIVRIRAKKIDAAAKRFASSSTELQKDNDGVVVSVRQAGV
jgi:hypothetical protein